MGSTYSISQEMEGKELTGLLGEKSHKQRLIGEINAIDTKNSPMLFASAAFGNASTTL